MAAEKVQPHRAIPNRDSELLGTGYQPVRPDNVVDVPPEKLPRPSGESPIASPKASTQDQPRESGSDS